MQLYANTVSSWMTTTVPLANVMIHVKVMLVPKMKNVLPYVNLIVATSYARHYLCVSFNYSSRNYHYHTFCNSLQLQADQKPFM